MTSSSLAKHDANNKDGRSSFALISSVGDVLKVSLCKSFLLFVCLNINL